MFITENQKPQSVPPFLGRMFKAFVFKTYDTQILSKICTRKFKNLLVSIFYSNFEQKTQCRHSLEQNTVR